MILECSEFAKAYQNCKPAERLLLDVRNDDETALGVLPNIVHIPFPELEDRVDELKKHGGKKIFIYCRSGNRAQRAADMLKVYGVENCVVAIAGGYETLKDLIK